MKLLIDHDEVVCEWLEPVVTIYNERNGTSFRWQEVDGWDLDGCLEPGAWQKILKYIDEPEFYDYVKPKLGAVEGLRQLMRDGHEIRIVTSVAHSAPNSYAGKIRWFKHHTPFLPLRNIVATSLKHEQDGDLLLDDAQHNLIPFKLSRPERIAVIFDSPGNRKLSGLPRVKEWPEFVELVRTMSLERR